MAELKKCPFCGSEATELEVEYHGVPVTQATCVELNCFMSYISRDIAQWNTRPIEDRLQAESNAVDDECNRQAEHIKLLYGEKEKLMSKNAHLTEQNDAYEWALDWFRDNHLVEYAVMLIEQDEDFKEK